MKIHIELKKKRYILYAAIIALLGVVGANISILHTNADKITKHIEYKSFLTQLIAVFRVSITNKEGNGIFYQLMAAGLFILFLIVFSYKYTVREVISAAILSILYGFCMWIGTVFSHRESWDYFLRNKYVMLLNAFYMLGNAIILFITSKGYQAGPTNAPHTWQYPCRHTSPASHGVSSSRATA